MMDDLDQAPPPTSRRSLPPARKAALHDLLVAEVSRTPWWRRMGRGATVGLGAGALVLAGGAASAAYIALKPASDLQSVSCYTAASTDTAKSTRVMIGSKTTAAQQAAGQSNSAPVDIKDPVGLCSDLWRQGVLSKDATSPGAPAGEGAASRPVPRLTACTMREGIAGVFPGDENVCKQLNLPNLG